MISKIYLPLGVLLAVAQILYIIHDDFGIPCWREDPRLALKEGQVYGSRSDFENSDLQNLQHAPPTNQSPSTTGPLRISSRLLEPSLRQASFDWADERAPIYQALMLSDEQIKAIQSIIRDSLKQMQELQYSGTHKVTEADGGEHIVIPALPNESTLLSEGIAAQISSICNASTGQIIRLALISQTYNFGNLERHLAITNLPEEIPRENPKFEKQYKYQEQIISDGKPGKWKNITMGKEEFEATILPYIEAGIRNEKK